MDDRRYLLNLIQEGELITLLTRLIRFGTAQWEYIDQQFLFSLV